jgi:hypothetical protein
MLLADRLKHLLYLAIFAAIRYFDGSPITFFAQGLLQFSLNLHFPSSKVIFPMTSA